MKNVENLRYMEAEFCLNDFASQNRYFIFELLIFLNLILTTRERVAKENWKKKICLKDI